MASCVLGEEPEERCLLQRSYFLAGQKAWKETLAVRLELPVSVFLERPESRTRPRGALKNLIFPFSESYFPLSYYLVFSPID